MTAPDEDASSTPKMLRSIERKLQARRQQLGLVPAQIPAVDVRQVIADLKFDSNIGKVVKPIQRKDEIGPHNTTLIGDFITSSFSSNDSKWLVQTFPKANLATLRNRVETGEAKVDKHYIFVMIGANQVFRATRVLVVQEVKALAYSIFVRNANAKVFFVGVLPRPSHNMIAKPRITEFNRFLNTAMKKIKKQFSRIFYLPAQVKFHNETEFNVLFNEDLCTLSLFGRMRLKKVLFEEAGFIKK